MIRKLSRHKIEDGMVNFWFSSDPSHCPPAISLPLELILQIAQEAKQLN